MGLRLSANAEKPGASGSVVEPGAEVSGVPSPDPVSGRSASSRTFRGAYLLSEIRHALVTPPVTSVTGCPIVEGGDVMSGRVIMRPGKRNRRIVGWERRFVGRAWAAGESFKYAREGFVEGFYARESAC